MNNKETMEISLDVLNYGFDYKGVTEFNRDSKNWKHYTWKNDKSTEESIYLEDIDFLHIYRDDDDGFFLHLILRNSQGFSSLFKDITSLKVDKICSFDKLISQEHNLNRTFQIYKGNNYSISYVISSSYKFTSAITQDKNKTQTDYHVYIMSNNTKNSDLWEEADYWFTCQD
ncbi:hypothetical protein [Marinoscillum luteum]|uniref:Uncharacterized protein n=1 Tax=Marinoscillum luteum TaxID=861051 RepID=A0ABW7N7K2_9BACT